MMDVQLEVVEPNELQRMRKEKEDIPKEDRP